jgi:stage II sporulation protein D
MYVPRKRRYRVIIPNNTAIVKEKNKMKRTLLVSAALFAAVFLIPLLTAGQVSVTEQTEKQPEESPNVTEPPQAEPGPPPSGPYGEPDTQEMPPVFFDDMAVTMLLNGTPQEMSLGDFIIGAVAAEMPALYPDEALKAQAAAIRTLALYSQGSGVYHRDALLCDDFNCCLDYMPLSERAGDWGERFDEFAKKITDAVRGTDGVVIFYRDEPIEALFFAATDGRTRSSAEVWGGEKPYLQSVASVNDLCFPGENLGHGVGLSQYGARQMALAGYGYEDILKWYYTGVEVSKVL